MNIEDFVRKGRAAQAAVNNTTAIDHLRELTVPALAAAKFQLETTGQVVPVFILELPNGELRELPLHGDTGNLLNSGRSKEFLFTLVKAGVKANRAIAVLFVSDTWTGRSNTQKTTGMSAEEFQAECAKHGNSVPALAKAGLVTMAEAITITAQTPDLFFTTEQIYERDDKNRRIKWGELNQWDSPATAFTGRMRMYGDDPL